MKHDYLRIFGNKSLFDLILFGSIVFFIAFIPSVIFNEKQIPLFIFGFYMSLYFYFKIVLHFSNLESFRSISGGKWEYLRESNFWRKLGYFEALESNQPESISTPNHESAIENT